ncbi:MAG TPA: hypothetical protein VFA48_05015 [Gammaproteobacteria bacterium]|nr:hypothetical protein [Gammaproteobacteria bacterium]
MEYVVAVGVALALGLVGLWLDSPEIMRRLPLLRHLPERRRKR